MTHGFRRFAWRSRFGTSTGDSIRFYVASFLAGPVLHFDLMVVIFLFAMIFRYLPDAKLQWRDVWLGATLTVKIPERKSGDHQQQRVS